MAQASIIFTIVTLTGLVIYLAVRFWPRSEGPPLYLRCKACGQRIKYFAHQVGKGAMCPSCQNRFVFPAPKAKK
jgi:hypothetical protein